MLDESIPHQLREHLPDHETVTAVYAGFGGFKNGTLLRAAEDAGFNVLVTADKTLLSVTVLAYWRSALDQPPGGLAARENCEPVVPWRLWPV